MNLRESNNALQIIGLLKSKEVQYGLTSENVPTITINLVITSDGKVYNNKKYIQKYEKKIKGLQKWLSRSQKGSKNREKIKLKLSRVYQKLRNARKYLIHQISKEITEENDIIVAEKLKISQMVKNSHLSKQIYDASWQELIRCILYKSKWKNKKFYQNFFVGLMLCMQQMDCMKIFCILICENCCEIKNI